MGMADITKKNFVTRIATATGKIILKKSTIDKIKGSQITKGDPFTIAEVAAITAVKRTPELIPHCHQIPIEKIDVSFKTSVDHINATVTVLSTARTGVEMEALIGVSIALNTIWDTIKYLEKDESGQYSSTKISDIMILKKYKGDKHEPRGA